MFGKRPVLLVDCGRFVSRQNSALHFLGPPFQVGKQRASGRFVAATSRHFLHQPRAVPILGGVGLRGNHDTVGAVLPDGNGCRPSFLFRVEPLGQPLPLANNNLRPSRQRLGCGLLEYASHDFAFRFPGVEPVSSPFVSGTLVAPCPAAQGSPIRRDISKISSRLCACRTAGNRALRGNSAAADRTGLYRLPWKVTVPSARRLGFQDCRCL